MEGKYIDASTSRNGLSSFCGYVRSDSQDKQLMNLTRILLKRWPLVCEGLLIRSWAHLPYIYQFPAILKSFESPNSVLNRYFTILLNYLNPNKCDGKVIRGSSAEVVRGIVIVVCAIKQAIVKCPLALQHKLAEWSNKETWVWGGLGFAYQEQSSNVLETQWLVYSNL